MNQVAVHLELLALHVICTDWWVVACLFAVKWNASQVALESLAQDRVERLLHDELHGRNAGHKRSQHLNLLDRRPVTYPLKIIGTSTKRSGTPLKQGPGLKYINWQGDIGNTLARHEIGADLFQQKAQDILLALDKFLVDKLELEVLGDFVLASVF